MPAPSRSGSAIIYCIALAAIVVVIGFGFLRSTMRDMVAGDRSQHLLLAQSAARAGIAEATEAIVADYAAASLEVGKGSAGSVVIADPPTFLDGPYRAPFVSMTSPDRLQNVDDNAPSGPGNAPPAGDNDVRAWDTVVNPMTRLFDHNTYGQTTSRYEWHTNGVMMYDGRGRYVEPNFHNLTRPSPATTTPVAVQPIKVLNLDPATAAPERHNGLFLDSSLRRVASDGTLAGDQAARASARYRLRYAIGVVDLGGHLLSNPKADLNFDWQDAHNEYREPPLWLQEAKEAWYNLAVLFPTYSTYGVGSNLSMPLRWQHVFLGRGDASNYDRHPGDSFPVTFPYMFRQQDATWWDSASGTNKPAGLWSLYAQKMGGPAGNAETAGLFRTTGITASAAGGEPLYHIGNGFWYTPLVYALPGPQPSWFTQHQSIQGRMTSDSRLNDGAYYYGESAPVLETAMFMPTPFGRGVVPWSGSGTRRWYEGHTTTPWYVNLLTAPPRVIHCMLFAYLPPSFKQFLYSEENFAKASSKTTLLGPWQSISLRRGPRGHDLFTELAGPAFSEWPAPTDASGVKPNFLAPDTRSAAQRYPGELWNDPDLDDLGRDIDVNTLVANPCCSHTGQSFLLSYWNTYEGINSYGSGWLSTPPAGWGAPSPGNGDWFFQRLGATSYYSYWWDIMTAFYSAVAVTRAAWVQYPNPSIDPNTAFAAPLQRDPTLYDSIEKLDRLFLRQLGEDMDNPGSGIPLRPITCSGSSNQVYSEASPVSNTIRTLVAGDLLARGTYTSAERGQVMERVLNDFRMSFFGASPQYYDRFRPLDFDGDGKVMCSCYASSGVPDEVAKGIDRHGALDPTLGPGRGAAPDADKWFSLTGTFFIGKSHYYRLICRGEVFDNVVQRAVSDATLESMLVVDPEGNDITQTHTLFQRWHFNRFTGNLSLVDR